MNAWFEQTVGRSEDTTLPTTPPVAEPPASRPPAPARLSRRGSLVLAAALVVVPILLFFFALAFITMLRRVASPLGYGMFADLGYVVLAFLIPAGIVAAVAVLIRGRRGAAGAVGSATTGAAPVTWQLGAPEHRRSRMLLIATAIAAASVAYFLVVNSLGLGAWLGGEYVLFGAGIVAVAGIAVAAVVALRALGPGRITSLRTRAFFVIAIAVLIPSLCLAALGVWAYSKSWDTATALVLDQSNYRASELAREISSIDRSGRFPAVERARLAGAVAAMYGTQGHQEGAQLATLAQIRQTRTLPGWAIKSLERRGYAIGGEAGPAGGRNPEIVAWRVGRQVVRYYVPVWSGTGFSAPVPIARLLPIALLGVALIVVLGLLGAWILSRSVVRPVRRLAAASGRLADGDVGVTVKPEGPRELRELAVSFNDMNAKLTRAQETEQAFLLSVSHELKTPLTSIRGYAEGIGDGTVTPDDGAEVIGAESSRLERLVGDLLESGRMRKAAFTVRSEAVDLAAVAEDVVRRYEATARDAGLTLLINTEAGGGAVADHDRVLQIVSNLVENAIRCTPAPGTVTITTAPGSITVADTGRGLTSDDLPRAFERFYLYSRYGTDRPVGTGLGLAIVKELAEAMGGTVSVSSAVGVGTAFTVALPVGEAPPAESAAPTTIDSDAATVAPQADAP